MKKALNILLGAALLLALSSVGRAQLQWPPAGQVVGKTTLTAAIASSSQTTVALTTLTITVGPFTAVTCQNPQWGLVIDGEIMRVTCPMPPGLNVNVSRGQAGTIARPHGSGQTVWAAPLQWLPTVGPKLNSDPPPRFRYETVPIGSVAYASFGNNTTLVAGTIYISDVYVPTNFVATGIGVIIGATGGTDKGLIALYDVTGNLIANSAVAGVTVGTASTIQERAFSPGPIFLPAGEYFVVYQQNGTTATGRFVAASTFTNVLTASATGTFGTLPATITVPTTFTANVGPIGYVY